MGGRQSRYDPITLELRALYHNLTKTTTAVSLEKEVKAICVVVSVSYIPLTIATPNPQTYLEVPLEIIKSTIRREATSQQVNSLVSGF